MLVRIALRIAVQEALRGRTLAGDNVLDSQISALDIDADGGLRTDQDRPFLAVYTDGGTIGPGNGVIPVFGPSSVELVIEGGISTAMVAENKETGETEIVGLGLPATDAVMETTLDLMMRGVADALVDPANDWAELVRQLFLDVAAVDRARVGQVANNTRLAAHEMRLRGTLIEEPTRGMPLGGTCFGAFLVKLEASGRPDLIKIKQAFEQVLSGASHDWLLVQRMLGISNAGLGALGLAPLALGADGDAATFSGSISVERGPD